MLFFFRLLLVGFKSMCFAWIKRKSTILAWSIIRVAFPLFLQASLSFPFMLMVFSWWFRRIISIVPHEHYLLVDGGQCIQFLFHRSYVCKELLLEFADGLFDGIINQTLDALVLSLQKSVLFHDILLRIKGLYNLYFLIWVIKVSWIVMMRRMLMAWLGSVVLVLGSQSSLVCFMLFFQAVSFKLVK
jgi:hypothetical protein